MNLTEAQVEAAFEVLVDEGWEAPHYARIRNFTPKEVAAGKLGEADDWVEAELWRADGRYERIAHWKGDTRILPWVIAGDPDSLKEAG